MTAQAYIVAMGGKPMVKSSRRLSLSASEYTLLLRLRRLTPARANLLRGALEQVIGGPIQFEHAPEQRRPGKGSEALA